MEFFEKFNYLCKKKRIPPTSIGRYLAHPISDSAVSVWKTKHTKPFLKTIKDIAEYFEIPEDFLTNDTYDIDDLKILLNQGEGKSARIPVYGTIAGGFPITAFQEIIDYEEIPLQLLKSGEFFGLKVKGNSMFPTIPDGSTVLIRRASDCENGQICAVLINGEEGTLKRVVKLPHGGIKLIPENDSFPVLTFSESDVESLPIVVIGIAEEVRTKLH